MPSNIFDLVAADIVTCTVLGICSDQVMGVFISVYATSLSKVNFTTYTTYTAICFGRTTIFRQKMYY
jgi:hypothetical protein